MLNTEKSGLQVFLPTRKKHDEHDKVNDNEGTWIPIDGAPDQIIINAGDLLPVWSNGRFQSALRRVVATPELLTTDRLSIVYFTGPSNGTLVIPIVLPGEPRRFHAVHSGDHLKAKLASTNKK